MEIRRSKTFLKRYGKLPFRIQVKTDEALSKFLANPKDSTLRNHALAWEFTGCRSIDVTGDLRILFRELSDGTCEIIELIDIWTHSQLYG